MAYLSRWEREYITSGVNEDFRADGRCCKDYRHFTLETGVVSNTSGSAKIKLVSIKKLPLLILNFATSTPGSHVRGGGCEGRTRCPKLGKAIRRQDRILC